MKYLLLFLFPLQAHALTIYGTHLEVTQDCQVKVSREGKSARVKLPISGECRFGTISNSNALDIRRRDNKYMVVIGAKNDSFTIIGIGSNGRVVVATDSAGSSVGYNGGYYDKEFDILSYRMEDTPVLK